MLLFELYVRYFVLLLLSIHSSYSAIDRFRVAAYLQRMESLHLTPYVEECIRNLSEKAECQSDIVLSSLARLQIVGGQIPSNAGVQSAGCLGLYVKALQAQLQALRRDLPQDPVENGQSYIRATSHRLSVAYTYFISRGAPALPQCRNEYFRTRPF